MGMFSDFLAKFFNANPEVDTKPVRKRNARLIEKKVRNIAKAWLSGRMTQVGIARQFRVPEDTVRDICRGKSYSHITGIQK